MDLQATISLKNFPDAFDHDTVRRTLSGAVCEWLDYDQHPDDLSLTLTTTRRDSLWVVAPVSTPVYAISDLHMGNGGPRDNFAFGDHEKQLLSFLDMVAEARGHLVICGDLFELWQSNISQVLTKRLWLLDRLASLNAIYVLGNHDADLRYFIDSGWLANAHPFFRTMCNGMHAQIGGRLFQFIHGHVADPYCAGDTPGLGRITAIYSGLAEDKNGSPMLESGRTVEGKVVGRLETLVSLWGRLRGKPDRFTEMNRALWALRDTMIDGNLKPDVIVCGHTHMPGRVHAGIYNCGTWAEATNSFVRIDPDGHAAVYDWDHTGLKPAATPNNTELPI